MAEIQFSTKVRAADPSERPVTFLGKRCNLLKVQFSDVSPYLAGRVVAEVKPIICTANQMCSVLVRLLPRRGRLQWGR